MKELLRQAREALENKNGKLALELTCQMVDLDENCVEMWLIAMKSFQWIYPIDGYDPNNELTCGRNALESALPEDRERVAKEIYRFYLDKILQVLKQDAQVLADGREIMTFYQARAYANSGTAIALTCQKDEPLVNAVLKSFEYCKALFEDVPAGTLRADAGLNEMARSAAIQWRQTYNYLEMRFEMYGTNLPRRMVEEGLRQYARFLRTIKDRKDLMEPPIPFNNVCKLDQLSFLED